jgi:Mrp family chromosome partitioning ATPase
MRNLNLAFIRAYKARQQHETGDAESCARQAGPDQSLNPVSLSAAELYVTTPASPLIRHRAEVSRREPNAADAVWKPSADTATRSARPLPAANSPESPAVVRSHDPYPRLSQSVSPWKPAWEVDQFAMSDCCKFVERHGTCLDDITLRIIAAAGSRKNVIPVRSWTRGEGRTTIAICLARKLAGLGLNVILLDADFDNPCLGPQLGITIEHGLDDVLAQRVPLAEACVSSIEDGLSVVPLRSPDIMIHDSHVQGRLAAVIESLSDHYDMVLIDAGPGSQVWDHGITVRQLGAVVVQDLRRTVAGNSDPLLSSMKRRRTLVLGLIENFSKAA